MFMRKILALVFAVVLAAGAARAQAPGVPVDPDLLVTMPVPPDKMTSLTERCNYLVDNYWKTFNPKSSFSAVKRLDHTLGIFFSFTPYATRDTVHTAINLLIDQVAKAKPQNLLELAKLAEGWTFADTAEYRSDELYFPFVKAIAENKKAKGPERDRFVFQYNQLLGSRLHHQAPDLELTLRDGTKKKFSEVKADHIILMFFDPECDDCRAAKTRLDADFTISTLVRRGEAAIVAVYTGDDPDWAEKANMPESWVVGACPDADRKYTMSYEPEIYYITGDDRIIQAKDLNAGQLIEAFRVSFSKPLHK